MRVLLVIDQTTGETERIREDDPNFSASIIMAADRAQLETLASLPAAGRRSGLANAWIRASP